MKLSTIGNLLDAVYKIKTTIVRPWLATTPHQLRLLEAFTQLRTDYVRQENWPLHKSGVDIDTYDVAAQSHYVLAYQDDMVYAGMRITKVSSLLGSLSYDMWQYAIDKEKFEDLFIQNKELHDAIDSSELWDVTRLIAATSVTGEHTQQQKAFSRIALFKIMSAGVAIAAPSEKSIWVFTISERMLRYLRRNDIEAHVIAHGKISEIDSGESYLCVIRPRHTFDMMKKTNPPVYLIAKQVFDTHKKEMSQ
jgi:N-acyl-L-homoserine lactone synthetase